VKRRAFSPLAIASHLITPFALLLGLANLGCVQTIDLRLQVVDSKSSLPIPKACVTILRDETGWLTVKEHEFSGGCSGENGLITLNSMQAEDKLIIQRDNYHLAFARIHRGYLEEVSPVPPDRNPIHVVLRLLFFDFPTAKMVKYHYGGTVRFPLFVSDRG
jgi:hypothetical protein